MNLFLFLVAIFLLLSILGFLDSKIDYLNREIKYYVYNENGSTYVRVPYLFWQQNKRRFVEEAFSEYVEYEGRMYNVIVPYKNQKHMPTDTNVAANLLYKDYCAKIDLLIESEPSVVINTQIQGDNNNINIIQNITYNIYSSIDSLLDENQISSMDKQVLELFKYKLKSNDASNEDAKNIIQTLTKYAPYISLANTLIGLVKTLFSFF